MALVTRSECGQTNAKPVKKLRRLLIWFIAGSALFAALIIIGAERISSAPSTQIPIKAQAGLTDLSVVITNLDDFTWPSAIVYLNGSPRNGYRARSYGPVASNHRLTIPFTDFVMGGERFNPHERRITQVMVSVKGHGTLTLSFQ
jgi:hypothetical protein